MWFTFIRVYNYMENISIFYLFIKRTYTLCANSSVRFDLIEENNDIHFALRISIKPSIVPILGYDFHIEFRVQELNQTAVNEKRHTF